MDKQKHTECLKKSERDKNKEAIRRKKCKRGGGGDDTAREKQHRRMCLRHICSREEMPDSHQTPAE